MSNSLVNVQNPNLDQLIDALKDAESFDPTMPFGIEEKHIHDNGMYMTYLPIAWYMKEDNMIDFVVMSATEPFTTVSCILKGLMGLKNQSYKIRCMKYKTPPNHEYYDIESAICRYGLQFYLVITGK